jgi:hypothetical protein
MSKYAENIDANIGCVVFFDIFVANSITLNPIFK